jgi:FYVE/RhoGEF/PH domain-containing protein 5/6
MISIRTHHFFLVTLSLNTSLHTHAQTLSLLALQRATPNLPLKLISPGRTLLKRGSLYQIERGSAPVQREFLLFSDCLLWLAPIESYSWDWDWSWSGSGISQNSVGTTDSKTSTIDMIRTRSKSEAEISSLRDDDLGLASDSSPVSPPQKSDRRKSHFHAVPFPPPPSMIKKHGSNDDKFVYKGRVELVDIEVVVGSALEDERRFEVLSPEGSFVVYAGKKLLVICFYIFKDIDNHPATEEERDDWTSEIRGAKTQLLVSLNVTNPNSTLTSSSSTNHIRRSLQALPFPPSDDRLSTLRASSSCLDVISVSLSPNGKGRRKEKEKRGYSAERRRKVDHWVPAIWIPDEKTSSCMRCGRSFGWRRRRHHCRLCGRCICASCSGRVSSIIIIPFLLGLISVSSSLIIFYYRLFSFRILMPNNKIHHHHRLNLREPVMHVMIPFSRSFILLHQEEKLLRISIMNLINLIRSHRFHIFHLGCLCLHYLFHANPTH